MQKKIGCCKKAGLGFTLAEILVSLVIFGTIAALVIPKVLFGNENSKRKAASKEAASAVVSALDDFSRDNSIQANLSINQLSSRIKYQARVTGLVDSLPGSTSVNCSANNTLCYQFGNGAVVYWKPTDNYLMGTTQQDAMVFYVDSDAVYSGSTTGDGKAIGFVLYANGQLRTLGTLLPSTRIGLSTVNPDPALDPSWFSWN